MKTDRKKKRLKRLGIFILLLAVLAAGMIIGVRLGGRNLPGLTVAGIPVGWLTEGETLKALTESGIADRCLRVSTYCGIEDSISAVEAGTVMPVWNSVEAAHDYGRSGGLFQGLAAYFRALRGVEHDVNSPDAVAGEEAVRALSDRICGRFSAMLGKGEWLIDTGRAELSLIKGGGSAELDGEGLCTAVIDALYSGMTELEYTELSDEAKIPDFAGILEQISIPPVSAELSSDGRYEIIPGKSSYSFDISQAEELWNKAEIGERIAVPLIEMYPDITESDLEHELYGKVLAEKTVSYAGVSAKQLSNIRKASALLDGCVILPGESLSFLETAGPLSVKNGYEAAPAYTGTHASDANGSEAGGGVSRVSTALYQAALSSGLNISERTPHRYEPDFSSNSQSAYVGALLEGGEKDLVICNPFDTPVKIRVKLDERAKMIEASVLGAD